MASGRNKSSRGGRGGGRASGGSSSGGSATATARSFPEYEKCKLIGTDASIINQSLLTKKGTENRPFGPGNKRMDIVTLRCVLLAQTNDPKSGGKRVFDLPNWFDCRIDPPPDLSVQLAEAAKAYGQGGAAYAQPGALDRMLQDLDDAIEGASGKEKDGLSALSNLIKALSNFPRQGDPDRAALESSMELLFTVLDSLINILKSVFSAGSATIEEIKNIVYTFVDMMFFFGDYIAETYALRSEIGARYFSERRAIGFPSKGLPGVRSIYSSQYGPPANREQLVTAAPAMVTVREWCKAGEDRNDPYFMPDGTTGKYNKAFSDWEAKKNIVKVAVAPIKAAFGDDPNPTALRRFFGMVFTLGSWFKLYTNKEVRDYLIDKKMKGAVQRGNNEPTLVNIGITPATASIAEAGPEERLASTWVEAANCCDADYWVPFWEDTDGPNFNFDLNTDTPYQERLEIRRQLLAFMKASWGKPRDAKCSFLCGGHKYTIWDSAPVQEFAAPMMAVWNMLDAWARASQPYYGNLRRTRLIEGLLTKNPTGDAGDPNSYGATATSRIPVLFGLAMNASGMSWEQAILSAFVPGGELGPEPRTDDPAFLGVKARCPGGPNDKSCLPCDTIRNRRPVGAKPIDIEMSITWSGSSLEASVEYKNWVSNLRANGYPDYYIDCLKQEARFTKKGDARGGISKSGAVAAGGGGAVSRARKAAQRGSGLRGLDYNRLPGGMSVSSRPIGSWDDSVRGLRAPTYASLGKVPEKTRAFDFKMAAPSRGIINVSKARKMGLIATPPEQRTTGLAGLGAPPKDGGGISVGTIAVAAAVAGLAYLALRKTKRKGR